LAFTASDPDTSPDNRRVAYAGPLRLEIVGVTTQRVLRGHDAGRLELQLQISWEPRLEPIVISQSLAKPTATATSGAEIAPLNAQASLDAELHSEQTTVEWGLNLELPPRSEKSIATVRGQLELLAPGRKVTFRFSNLEAADNEQQRQGLAVVTLDTFRRNNQLWEALVRLSYDSASGGFESHRNWFYNNPCRLIDAQGGEIEIAAIDPRIRKENEVGFAYLFDIPDGPDGVKLEYETPAAIIRTTFDYEFRDVPLP